MVVTLGVTVTLPVPPTTLLVTPPPETAQAVALAAVQLKVTLSPVVMVEALALKVPMLAAGTTEIVIVAGGVGKPSALRQINW